MALTLERLREVLNYDPVTGFLTWRIAIGGPAIVGGRAGGSTEGEYLRLRIDGYLYRSHRLAWFHFYGEPPPRRLDHKDRIKSHNWIDNLRPATASQNAANRPVNRNNATGFKGVSWDVRHKRYRAQIMKEGKKMWLGYFDEPEEARATVAAKALELFGEFAHV